MVYSVQVVGMNGPTWKTSMICAGEDGVNRPSYKIQSKPILEKPGGKLGHIMRRLGHLIVVYLFSVVRKQHVDL